MKPLAIFLIVLGVLGLLYGGLSWTRKDKVVDAGPIEITADKHESLPIPPIAGAALPAVGRAQAAVVVNCVSDFLPRSAFVVVTSLPARSSFSQPASRRIPTGAR